MDSASSNAYISKKALVAISKKRQERQQNKSKPTPSKPFKEDEEQKREMPRVEEESASDEEYERQNRSCESVSSDELDGDLNLSDDEDKAKAFRKQNKATRQEPARKFRQEIDTNVFKIRFSSLNEKSEMATGDPFFCTKCKAVFNKFSSVTT
mmetsp:Transcript_9966/g.15043  ORF Transcript_9966/g.15043 Transcript_9966/m.15043 type:complete len:153 (-) Transcript_9966:2048-2506(-)